MPDTCLVTPGGVEADFGFTGHYFHAPSGLHLALYRAYDADLGRWLSRDPIGENGGLNLYAYVMNSPVGSVDPLGLADLTLKNQGDAIGQQVANAFNDPNRFIVNAHSDGRSVVDQRGQGPLFLSPRDLGNQIRANPKYKPGMCVQLQCCQTGNNDNGIPFAQKLANELGTRVQAPQGDWVGDTGGKEQFNNPKTRQRDPNAGYRNFYPEYVPTATGTGSVVNTPSATQIK